jgi:hypothetical protein
MTLQPTEDMPSGEIAPIGISDRMLISLPSRWVSMLLAQLETARPSKAENTQIVPFGYK